MGTPTYFQVIFKESQQSIMRYAKDRLHVLSFGQMTKGFLRINIKTKSISLWLTWVDHLYSHLSKYSYTI